MAEDKEIIYRLTVYVDDGPVFSSSYPDTTMLIEEIYKAEKAVERALEEDEEMEDEDN